MQKKYGYWLLLIVLLTTAGLIFSMEPAYAHYESEAAVYNTVLPYEGSPVKSDYLSAEDEQIILLGDLPEEGKALSFTLESDLPAEGVLQWTVDKPEYLIVQKDTTSMVLEGEGNLIANQSTNLEEITNEYQVQLAGGSKATITLLLVPCPGEKDETVNITVTWGGYLRGVFRCNVPALGEGTPPDVTIPEETQPEETLPEETTPEETTPEETTPEETAPEETTPEETTPEETNPGGNSSGDNTSGEAAPAAETTEPTDATEPTEAVEVITEPPVLEPDDPVDPVEPPETEASVAELPVKSLDSFAPGGYLPIYMEPTAEGSTVTLSTTLAANTTFSWAAFPEFTRYSIDGGSTWFLLYESSYITFPTAEKMTVLVDFPDTYLTESLLTQAILIRAEEFSGETAVAVGTIETAADMDLSELPDHVFLNPKNPLLEFTIPTDWMDAEFTYVAEVLTTGENGQTIYVEAPLAENSLMLGYTLPQQVLTEAAAPTEATTSGEAAPENPTEQGMQLTTAYDPGIITLQLGKLRPPAGTYRLRLTWTLEGTCFHEERITFFINYSDYALSQERGGAGQ